MWVSNKVGKQTSDKVPARVCAVSLWMRAPNSSNCLAIGSFRSSAFLGPLQGINERGDILFRCEGGRSSHLQGCDTVG